MGIGERIRSIRGRLPRSEFATKIGISQGAIQKWEENTSVPKADALARLKDAFGISIDWLLTGEGEMYGGQPPQTQHPAEASGAKYLTVSGEGEVLNQDTSVNIDDWTYSQIDPEQFAYIPMVKSKLSAGGGSFEIEEKTSRHYAFRKTWLSYVGSSVRNLVLVFTKGDSMMPLVYSGDLVMIDRGRTTIHDGGIYAIGIHDALFLKN